MLDRTDILISGGGVAGLTAAAAFGSAGFNVICVDPSPPVTERDAEEADLRTTAFLQPAQDFLNRAGVWPLMAPESTPLATMRIVDAGGGEPVARVSRDFESRDVSDGPFGYNVPNWLIRRVLLERLKALPNVSFRPGVATTRFLGRTAEALATLSDGSRISARLAIAADGRDSFIRKALGIAARRMEFGQRALTFSVTHDTPHENVSTEIHRTGGPFTLVPLPDHEGKPCSAVVWMETEANAQELLKLDTEAFEAAATARSAGLFGVLRLASRRTSWPIISQLADSFFGPRTAIVAEAAHVVPPIGAQGLNMSLADLSTLLDLATEDAETLGAESMLKRYQEARYGDVRTRVLGVSVLNRTSMADLGAVKDARALGIRAIHDIAPIRTSLMKLGMGRRRTSGS
ncbi:MAG: UbiH/UbiF family hydroxylase [Pseudomonadota bacterium]